MNQKNLLKLSLLISIFGILTLLILLTTLEPTITKISEIESKYLNKNIKIIGKITNIKDYKQYNFFILTISDSTSKIDVLVEYLENKKPNFSKNQNILITGRLTQYKDNLQIQANEIKEIL